MKINIKNKVLLFDFDGTLVETEFLAKKVVDLYFKEKNFPYPIPFAEMIVGRTWHAATENIYAHANQLGIRLDPPEILHDEFKRRYRDMFVTGVKLIPGLKECLPLFKAEAKFMGIVTGSDRDEVGTILRAHHLEGFFEQIWAYGDYELSKPDPSPYLKAIHSLKAKPEDVLVFEDSAAGMESSHRAGLPFIQVTHEAHAKEVDARAMLVIQDWHELI